MSTGLRHFQGDYPADSMVPHCHCNASNCPCDGVLAGGLCDGITEDERDNLFDDAEDFA